METIKEILMRRDGMTAEEAGGLIEEAKNELETRMSYGDIEGAYMTCEEYFGLEPDYIEELF